MMDNIRYCWMRGFNYEEYKEFCESKDFYVEDSATYYEMCEEYDFEMDSAIATQSVSEAYEDR